MRNMTFPTKCLFALALVVLLIIPETLLTGDSEALMELGLTTGKKYQWRSAQQATVFLKVENDQQKPEFVSVRNKFSLTLSASGLVVESSPMFSRITRGMESEALSSGPESSEYPLLELAYQNVEFSSNISFQEGSEARFNYFLGNDPNRWVTNLSAGPELVQEGIYPGIDATYIGNISSLTSRFRVAAGADPEAIRFKILGSDRISSTPTGGLEIYRAAGSSHRIEPVFYQYIDGELQPISGSHTIYQDKSIGMKVGAYDLAKTLFIDQVLAFSTQLGGKREDKAHGIAVDGEGNMYVVGETSSSDFPLVTPYDSEFIVDDDSVFHEAFVSKFNPSGELIYSTYLGGQKKDTAYDVAVDNLGNAYITGETYSSDFPIQSPWQEKMDGLSDAFVAKLSPRGDMLEFSTFFGGNGQDKGLAIALDDSQAIYVTGSRGKERYEGGQGTRAFVAKFNPLGNSLIYLNTVVGDRDQEGVDIVADSPGNAFVVGTFGSLRLDPEGNRRGIFGPGSVAVAVDSAGKIFTVFGQGVARLSVSGNSTDGIWSPGGDGDTSITDLQVGPEGFVYVVGTTTATDLARSSNLSQQPTATPTPQPTPTP